MELSGTWRFCLDPQGHGVQADWFKSDLSDRVELPGTTDTNQKGDRNDAVERGRLTQRYPYWGAAWYQRSVEIPEAWRGKSLALRLERVQWRSELWIDDHHMGAQDSLTTPHVYRIGPLTPGTHRLTLRVDNRMQVDVGKWACALTEETQTAWNGVLGDMTLTVLEPVHIEGLQIYPDAETRSLRIQGKLHNDGQPAQHHQIRFQARLLREGEPVAASAILSVSPTEALQPFSQRLTFDGDIRPWDEFDPALYALTAELLDSAGTVLQTVETSFGFRTLDSDGKHLRMNGRRVFLRGNVDGGLFPLTGHAPLDRTAWLSYFQTILDYGMNHVRFHSWCPPEAAFRVADELGIMLQVEAPMWRPHGDISPHPDVCAFIRAETERILDSYGNHPSFCFFALGNELGTGKDSFLLETIRWCRQTDPRRFYSTTMRPYEPDQPDDFFQTAGVNGIPVRGEGRIGITRPDTLHDYEAPLEQVDKPIIAHENGQFASYPDFAERRHYTGVLEARHYAAFEVDLKQQGLAHHHETFPRASGRLSAQLYKEELETAFRSPSMSGFQILGLTDMQGWGTATIGILNALGESKGFISPEAWRRFCGPVVPLARFEKHVWTSDETLKVRFEASCYTPENYRPVAPVWRLVDDGGHAVATGRLDSAMLITGGVSALGVAEIPLARIPAPRAYTLQVVLDEHHYNSWDLWVYPAEPVTEEPAGVYVCTAWNTETQALLQAGHSVLLLPSLDRLTNVLPGRLAPVFWAQPLFCNQPGQMGIWVDAEHPAFGQFPTEYHANWQWWELLDEARALIIDDAPLNLSPLVQPIDTFQRNHQLSLLFEANVGPGRLLCATMNLTRDLASRPVARQLRRSLLAYMASPAFQPETRLDPERIGQWIAPVSAVTVDRIDSIDANVVLDMEPSESGGCQVHLKQDGFRHLVLAPITNDSGSVAWSGSPLAMLLYCPHDFSGDLCLQVDPSSSVKQVAIRVNGKILATDIEIPLEGGRIHIPIGRKDSCFEVLHVEIIPPSDGTIAMTRITITQATPVKQQPTGVEYAT